MVTGKDTLHSDDLALLPVPPPAQTIAHSSIVGNFPYKKSALPASAYYVLDSLAAILKNDGSLNLQVEGYTDGIGGDAYNTRLAQARVNACIRYLVKKGIDPARLRGKSFGKCCPLEPETIDGKDNPAGREANRRVEYRLYR
jgi:outer membrane protein OmpA-like peptidoglycan-associated protein